MADHNDFANWKKKQKIFSEKTIKFWPKLPLSKAEIDIIAQFENQIVIVEVKARATDAFICLKKRLTKKIRLIVSVTNF